MRNEERYRQELSREISPFGNALISLSAVTPASSVFIILPAVLATAGTGSILAMIIAAIICVFMAFCWAELGAAYPITGGDYALVYHAFKGPWEPLASPLSFMVFVLGLIQGILGGAVIAVGIASYLPMARGLDPAVVGCVLTVVATLLATLNIRLNAFVTGTFLVIELLALSSLVVLGIMHFHPRFGDVLDHWTVGGNQGVMAPVPFAAIMAATSVAIYAYNGFNVPVFFSEETRGRSRGIASAILWSLAIGVTAELVPTVAVIFGAPDLAKITTSSAPMSDFILATSGKALNDIVSVGMALAVFNAVIAVILSQSRVIYASGRDRAYPGVLSEWVAAVHPRFQSPWVAAMVQGLSTAILCLTVPQATLISLTGMALIFLYALIALSSLIGRAYGATSHGSYRMPLWPAVPVLALAALAYIGTQQELNLLLVTLGEMAVGLVWWAVVVLPRPGKAWTLKQPIFDVNTAEKVEVYDVQTS